MKVDKFRKTVGDYPSFLRKCFTGKFGGYRCISASFVFRPTVAGRLFILPGDGLLACWMPKAHSAVPRCRLAGQSKSWKAHA